MASSTILVAFLLYNACKFHIALAAFLLEVVSGIALGPHQIHTQTVIFNYYNC